MAEPGAEIGFAHQWALDAWRGNLEVIGLLDWILDIERRRHGTTYFLAVLDRHGAVLALGHDLKRQAILRQETAPHEAEPDGAKDRRDNQRDARIDAALADDAIIVQGFSG